MAKQWWYNNKGKAVLTEEMPEGYNCDRLGRELFKVEQPKKAETKKKKKKAK